MFVGRRRSAAWQSAAPARLDHAAPAGDRQCITDILGLPSQYSEACRVSLQSVVKVSIFPGFEIVSTTQSIRRISELPAGAFQLPSGYRQVEGRGAAK